MPLEGHWENQTSWDVQRDSTRIAGKRISAQACLDFEDFGLNKQVNSGMVTEKTLQKRHRSVSQV